MIINDQGLALALERADIANAWQLPQGGLEPSEEPLQAVAREIAEETGITKNNLSLLAIHPELLVYELPASARNEKTGRGQVQYWFLFRFGGLDNTIDVKGGGEFRTWRWMVFEELLHSVAEFRKPVYQRLIEEFQCHFAQPKSVHGTTTGALS